MTGEGEPSGSNGTCISTSFCTSEQCYVLTLLLKEGVWKKLRKREESQERARKAMLQDANARTHTQASSCRLCQKIALLLQSPFADVNLKIIYRLRTQKLRLTAFRNERGGLRKQPINCLITDLIFKLSFWELCNAFRKTLEDFSKGRGEALKWVSSLLGQRKSCAKFTFPSCL